MTRVGQHQFEDDHDDDDDGESGDEEPQKPILMMLVVLVVDPVLTTLSTGLISIIGSREHFALLHTPWLVLMSILMQILHNAGCHIVDPRGFQLSTHRFLVPFRHEGL